MKGLHKNSLRKGEPNKTIVEDIIETIKAEVERLQHSEIPHTDEWWEGADYVRRQIKAKLSEIEKSEKPTNPTIKKLRALIKRQIRQEELNFAALGGGGQTFCINTLEWVLKQLDTLQEQPVCEDVENASNEYASHIQITDTKKVCGADEWLYLFTDLIDAFKAGANWQKEKDEAEITFAYADGCTYTMDRLRREAVEYEVGMHGEPIEITFDKYVQRARGIFPGDKVRVIIVKEDKQ